jgi:hypothetical protein
MYNMEFLLGDFNAKLGRGDICKPTRGMDDNDDDGRVTNFATSKNLFVKSIMFGHRKIHKHTRTSPDRETHNRLDHIMTGRIWPSSILDVPAFKGADCDTDHCLVVANVRERLLVNTQECTEVCCGKI